MEEALGPIGWMMVVDHLVLTNQGLFVEASDVWTLQVEQQIAVGLCC